jgi:hypothetical protein
VASADLSVRGKHTCSFFLLALFLSPLQHFFLSPVLFSSHLLSFFFSHPMSTLNNEDLVNYDSLDEGMDNLSEYCPSSVGPSAGSIPRTADSSQVSMPSGLPLEMIVRLTHDKLQHNPEFMKHLSLVDTLLLIRSTPSPHKSSLLSPCTTY